MSKRELHACIETFARNSSNAGRGENTTRMGEHVPAPDKNTSAFEPLPSIYMLILFLFISISCPNGSLNFFCLKSIPMINKANQN